MLDTHRIVALDPGQNVGQYYVHDGLPGHFKGSMMEFLAAVVLPLAPCVLALESTFLLYDPKQHNEFIRVARKAGVELHCYSPRLTANYNATRRVEKSDAADATAIYRLELSTTEWAPARLVEEREPTLAQRQVAMRRSGYANADAEQMRAALATRPVPEDLALAICETGGRKFSGTFALSIALLAEDVAARGGGRSEFDRLAGLHGNGFPGLVRSNFYKHTVSRVMNAQAPPPPGLVRVNAEGKESDVDSWASYSIGLPEAAEPRKDAMRLMRRASRWIFSTVRDAGTCDSGHEPGTHNSANSAPSHEASPGTSDSDPEPGTPDSGEAS